jgi:hypothetical protein
MTIFNQYLGSQNGHAFGALFPKISMSQLSEQYMILQLTHKDLWVSTATIKEETPVRLSFQILGYFFIVW